MAIQEQRTLPAPFIEDIGQDFAKSLIGVTGLPAESNIILPLINRDHLSFQENSTSHDPSSFCLNIILIVHCLSLKAFHKKAFCP